MVRQRPRVAGKPRGLHRNAGSNGARLARGDRSSPVLKADSRVGGPRRANAFSPIWGNLYIPVTRRALGILHAILLNLKLTLAKA